MRNLIPAIPPNTSDADLIGAVNDRIRRINLQQLGTSTVTPTSGAIVMEGTAAAKPVGLVSAQAGTLYFTTDTFQVYWWTGAEWKEITPANSVQQAYGSGTYTLTGVFADIPGCSITLARGGRHLLLGCFDFFGANALDVGAQALGRCVADGSVLTGDSVFSPLIMTGAGLNGSPVSLRATVFQQWLYTAPATGKVVKLQAAKIGGTGTSGATTGTNLTATWIGP